MLEERMSSRFLYVDDLRTWFGCFAALWECEKQTLQVCNLQVWCFCIMVPHLECLFIVLCRIVVQTLSVLYKEGV
jgi:hypothetical protein